MWQSQQLGGEHMPEDVHPILPPDGKALLHYFTLGMCLNYQRNSYALWEACTATFEDAQTKWVFDPSSVYNAETGKLREALMKHRVALQPNRHIANWQGVCRGIVLHADNDVRNLLSNCKCDLAEIRQFVQERKKDFPYLAGPKICNYWLYVITQYTSFSFENRSALSVAPDTHVVQASVKLGLIDEVDATSEKVEVAWRTLLAESTLSPIDVHTPLWLWSRGGFEPILG